MKLNEGHALSTKYLCESGQIHLRAFLRTDEGDLEIPFGNFVKASFLVGTSWGGRGDGVDHLARLNCDYHHHVFLANQAKYDDAEPLFKRALAIREETLDSRHPGVATSLNNLAVLLQSQVMWHWARCFHSPFGVSYVSRVEAERRTCPVNQVPL